MTQADQYRRIAELHRALAEEYEALADAPEPVSPDDGLREKLLAVLGGDEPASSNGDRPPVTTKKVSKNSSRKAGPVGARRRKIDWDDKKVEMLGKGTDGDVAAVIGCTLQTVANQRKKRDIPPFKNRQRL